MAERVVDRWAENGSSNLWDEYCKAPESLRHRIKLVLVQLHSLSYPVSQSLSFGANGSTRLDNLEELQLAQNSATTWLNRYRRFTTTSPVVKLKLKMSTYVERRQRVDFEHLAALELHSEK